MNQSIEDASLSLDDLRHHTEVGTGLSKDAMLNRAADEIEQLRAQLREARQSINSELSNLELTSLNQQSVAWLEVWETLKKIKPEIETRFGCAKDLAIQAINELSARQSSQSEPFAYINPLFLELKEKGALGAEIAFFKPSDRCLPIYLAAPQQLQVARQSSQSEPVAEALQLIFRLKDQCHNKHLVNEACGFLLKYERKQNIAAPQQGQDKLAVSPPSGWKLVPIEPTEEMKYDAVKYAGDVILQEVYPNGKYKKAVSLDSEMFGEAYKAMLSASPTAPIDRDK
jgi:hypothetical protein